MRKYGAVTGMNGIADVVCSEGIITRELGAKGDEMRREE